MVQSLSYPLTHRRRVLLVVGGLTILLVACLGPVPPLQRVALTSDAADRAVLERFSGLWWDDDLLKVAVVDAAAPSALEIRLPPMFEAQHAWVEGDQIRIAVEIGEERHPETMALFRLDDRRMGLIMADDPRWCVPIIYERRSVAGVFRERAARAMHSAYDEAIGWLASVL